MMPHVHMLSDDELRRRVDYHVNELSPLMTELKRRQQDDDERMREIEIRDLQFLYRLRGRSDKHRKPARPDSGGAS